MLWGYEPIRDLINGGVLVWLVVLLYRQKGFLQGQVRVLKEGQESLVNQATALKAHTERFLTLFEQLSPEKLVARVNATEELFEKNRDAEVAAIKRESEQQLKVLESQVEKSSTAITEIVDRMTDRYAKVAYLLGFSLYHHPRGVRERILEWTDDQKLRVLAEKLVAKMEKDIGPSPADERFLLAPQVFGPSVGLILSGALPGPVPSSQKAGGGARDVTDPIPGTPGGPKGGTKTSP